MAALFFCVIYFAALGVILVEFNLIDLKILVSTDDPRRINSLVLSMGRDFATACRRVTCDHTGIFCRNCPMVAECSWYQVFAQELSADPVALKRHQKPPLPFAFSFRAPESAEYVDGMVESRLVVIGRAIHHLEMILFGFSEFLSNNSCQFKGKIEQILCRDYQGTLLPLNTDIQISQNNSLVVLSVSDLLAGFPDTPSSVTFKLLSPLKILKNGKQLKYFDFSQFARSLMRRVSSLAYYYADFEFSSDYLELALHSADFVCVEDCFLLDVNTKGGGVIGQGCFRGDFTGYMPFILLGTFLNVGKSATYGMGCYVIDLA